MAMETRGTYYPGRTVYGYGVDQTFETEIVFTFKWKQSESDYRLGICPCLSVISCTSNICTIPLTTRPEIRFTCKWYDTSESKGIFRTARQVGRLNLRTQSTHTGASRSTRTGLHFHSSINRTTIVRARNTRWVFTRKPNQTFLQKTSHKMVQHSCKSLVPISKHECINSSSTCIQSLY